MKPGCTVYVFNVQDGTYVEAKLLSLHGSKVMVAHMGYGVPVSREFVTKDMAEIKRLRMAWETVQVKLRADRNT